MISLLILRQVTAATLGLGIILHVPRILMAALPLVATLMQADREAMDAMDTSVPVVHRRKTGGRARGVAAATLAVVVVLGLIGQAQAYECKTNADCNYYGCADVSALYPQNPFCR